MKSFEYIGYKDCSFFVSHYLQDNKAIAFIIVNKKTRETIAKCTTFDSEINYSKGITSIKNYSENTGMTDYLIDLGIVTEILERKLCNGFEEVNKSLYTDKSQTIDICKIDLKKLKEYAIEWHYDIGRKESD